MIKTTDTSAHDEALEVMANAEPITVRSMQGTPRSGKRSPEAGSPTNPEPEFLSFQKAETPARFKESALSSGPIYPTVSTFNVARSEKAPPVNLGNLSGVVADQNVFRLIDLIQSDFQMDHKDKDFTLNHE